MKNMPGPHFFHCDLESEPWWQVDAPVSHSNRRSFVSVLPGDDQQNTAPIEIVDPNTRTDLWYPKSEYGMDSSFSNPDIHNATETEDMSLQDTGSTFYKIDVRKPASDQAYRGLSPENSVTNYCYC